MLEAQERIIHSFLADVEQQEDTAIVAKPIAEEQNAISQILQDHLNSPGYDRKQLRELRKFLKQPLVGASVQILKKAIQSYSGSNDLGGLIQVVSELYQQQGSGTEETSSESRKKRLRREDLRLICYEYIYA